MPLVHNNDANAPFEYRGVHHLFMQANFNATIEHWNGGIGLGHLTSPDLAHWHVQAPPVYNTVHFPPIPCHHHGNQMSPRTGG